MVGTQLAREIELGLPVELTHNENVELVREYVKSQFVSKGMIADFSIHEDDASGPPVGEPQKVDSDGGAAKAGDAGDNAAG